MTHTPSGRTRKRWLSPFLFLLCVVAAGCAAIPDERAKPFEYPFPKDLRYDRGAAIVFFVDGLNLDAFDEMLAAGELPNVQRYFVDRGVRVRRAVTTFPSVTTPNCVVMTTGCFQGHTNVPQIRWFDRTEMVFRDYATIAEKDTVDDDYAVANVFERLTSGWSASIFLPVHRGATRWIENWTSAGPPYFFHWFNLVDRISMVRWSIISDIARHTGEFPRVVWMHLIAPTCTAVIEGIGEGPYREAIRHADAQIGRLLSSLEAQGILDRLTIFFVSDHGQTPTDPRKGMDVEDVLEYELDMRAARLHKLYAGKPLETRLAYYNRYKAVFACAGERSGYIYLRKPGKGSSWLVRPTVKELRAYPTKGGARDVIRHFAMKPGVDVAIAGDRHRVLLVGARGEAAIEADGDRRRYTVLSGDDPLGYSTHPATRALVGRFVSREEWYEASLATEYPDAVVQLPILFESRRVGDVVISMKPGFNLSRRCKAGHGSLNRADMLTPMIVAGKGVRRGEIDHVRLVDLLPTLLDAIGEDPTVGAPMDGRSFWEQVRSRPDTSEEKP